MEDWQSRLHKLKERGRHLLQTELWSDCRFLVGSAPNQRIIAGHKLILAMASPVFERMFFGNLPPDKNEPIVIPDVQPEAFYVMLEYIYTDTINISSFDKACELCYVANKYMLPNVVENCTQFLWSDLSPKNACRAYEFAKLFDEPRLMESSMKIIASKTLEVFNDPSFCDIEVSTLMAILDQDKLNINSELDLFNALVKYATERGMLAEDESVPQKQDEHEPSCSRMDHMDAHSSSNHNNGIVEIKTEPDVSAMLSDHVDDELHIPSPGVDDVVVVDSDSGAEADDHQPSTSHNSNQNFAMDSHRVRSDKDTLRSAVKKIRFLTMSPQQFAEGPARSKLLEQHEALAILIKISSPTINNCPMPEGFCYSRTSRSWFEPRSHFEMSSYRHSIPSNGGSSPLALIDSQQHNSGAGTSAASSSQQANAVGVENDVAATNDTRKNYCVRTVNQQFDYRNTSVTDCGVTFQVDTNIWITGVQVPTQVLCGELMNSAGFSDRYMEILYAHIQDMQGSRLTYTHCTSRVRYDSLLEISFDRPVYIYRNQRYKVFVVFNKVGWYPMYTCVPDVVCNRVKFSFNVGDPHESVRDGLIRAIVFSIPTL